MGIKTDRQTDRPKTQDWRDDSLVKRNRLRTPVQFLPLSSGDLRISVAPVPGVPTLLASTVDTALGCVHSYL